MKKLLSMVLTIAILATIFSMAANLNVVSAVSNNSEESLVNVTELTDQSISTSNTISTPSFIEELTISVGDVVYSENNEEITVPIKFTNIPDTEISTANFSISYDNTKLQHIKTIAGDIVTNPDVNFASNKVSNGLIKVLFLDYTQMNEQIKNDGVFTYLSFKVNDMKEALSSIKVYDVVVGDQNIRAIRTKFENIYDSSTPSFIEELTISVGDVVYSENNEEITVPINFTNIPDSDICCTDFCISYDSTKLQHIKTAAGDIITNPDVNFESNKVFNGLIKVLFLDYTTHNEHICNDGVFAYLSFKVNDLENALSSIKVYDITVGDKNLRTVRTKFENIYDSSSPVPQNELTVTLDSINASPNEYITVPLKFKNVPKDQILSFDMQISYNSNLLEYITYEPGFIVPNAKQNFCIHKSSNGTLNLLFLDYNIDQECIKLDGLVANLKFKVLSSSDESTSIEISNSSFCSNYLNSISSTSIPGTVYISEAPITPESTFEVKISSQQANVGENIKIPITFSNIPEKGISACDMSIAYDPNKLDYVSYDAGDIVINPDQNIAIGKPHNGLLKILFLDYTVKSEYISSDGIFITLNFKVSSTNNTSTTIHMLDSTFADMDITPFTPKISPGTIDIIGSVEPTPTPIDNLAVDVDSVEGKTGDIVLVPINLTNVPSKGISGFDISVSYDKTKLEYIASESANMIPYMVTSELYNGNIKLVLQTTNLENKERIEEDCNISNIAFRILESNEQSIPISIKDAFFFYELNLISNIERINAVANPGYVNVVESTSPTPVTSPANNNFTVSVGSVQGNKGDLVTVPITFENIPDSEVSVSDITVIYDATLLECVSVEAGGIVPASTDFWSNISSNGLIKLLYLGDYENNHYISEDGVFSNITFKLLTSNNKSPQIYISTITAGDRNLKEFPITIVNSLGKITTYKDAVFEIGSAQANTGDLVTIPISISDIPDEEIHSLETFIYYSPFQLEYVSYEPSETLPCINVFETNNLGLDLWFFNYINDSNNYIKEDAVLIYLTFRVIGSSGRRAGIYQLIPSGKPLGSSDMVLSHGYVDINDPTGHTVSGHVYSNLETNKTSDFSFNEGVRVEIEDLNLFTLTDENGYFEIKNVPDGNYTLNISKVNHLTRRLDGVSVDKDITLAEPIELWAGDFEINGAQDGAINLEDIMQICKSFNTIPEDINYNALVDLNKDNAVNLQDIMIVAKHFNKTSSDY